MPNCISANAKHRYFSTSHTHALATAHGSSTPFNGKGIPAHDAPSLAFASTPHASQRHVAKPVTSVYDRANTNFSAGDTPYCLIGAHSCAALVAITHRLALGAYWAPNIHPCRLPPADVLPLRYIIEGR
ncbi:hypothetical protein C8R44DRAFT_880146 [Mycena epipterygia]|nr:hypothetical protein C8R44DRAFT_880146 [Mycena epipterygia]